MWIVKCISSCKSQLLKLYYFAKSVYTTEFVSFAFIQRIYHVSPARATGRAYVFTILSKRLTISFHIKQLLWMNFVGIWGWKKKQYYRFYKYLICRSFPD